MTSRSNSPADIFPTPYSTIDNRATSLSPMLAKFTEGESSSSPTSSESSPVSYEQGQRGKKQAKTDPQIRLPQRKGGMQLWQFMYAVLEDPAQYSELMEWTENRNELEFRMLEPEAVAIWWGYIKHRPNTTYERLSRSLRYYYDKGILKKMGGERFLYRFCVSPEAMYKNIGNSDCRPKLKPMPMIVQQRMSKYTKQGCFFPHNCFVQCGGYSTAATEAQYSTSFNFSHTATSCSSSSWSLPQEPRPRLYSLDLSSSSLPSYADHLQRRSNSLPFSLPDVMKFEQTEQQRWFSSDELPLTRAQGTGSHSDCGMDSNTDSSQSNCDFDIETVMDELFQITPTSETYPPHHQTPFIGYSNTSHQLGCHGAVQQFPYFSQSPVMTVSSPTEWVGGSPSASLQATSWTH